MLTTFDPAHKHPSVVLSPDKLSVSSTEDDNTGINVRSTSGKDGSERSYVEFTATVDLAPDENDNPTGFVAVAIVNSSFVFGPDPGTNLSSSVNSFAYYSDGKIYNDVLRTEIDPYNGGTAYIELDRGAGTAVFGSIGGRSVPIDISALGPGLWYVAVQVTHTGDLITANFGETPFERTPSPAWNGDLPRGPAARFVLGM